MCKKENQMHRTWKNALLWMNEKGFLFLKWKTKIFYTELLIYGITNALSACTNAVGRLRNRLYELTMVSYLVTG